MQESSHKTSEEAEKSKENDQGACLQMVETEAYWVADFPHPDYQTREANNTEWIEQVSRPRSDWEYLRQERYQEMLDPFAEKEEIRLILCRRSVSNFLSSGMRDKIDQLMICRSQGDQRQDKKQVFKGGDEEGEYVYEYEGTERQQFVECPEYENEKQKQNQGQEPSECSYQAASPSTNYSSQDMTGRNSSCSARPTFEMDMIYELRRHMEQLHEEISELRKSMKCCTDMQIKVHRSIKKEVAAALTHPGKRGTNNGRRCCLCCKVQVDCVLYRCGHMCTCFECANELHWSTGKCPICRAQILDVVRTHSNLAPRIN